MGNPLRIPKIVAMVLKFVDSKTLVAAAQVNLLWATLATDVCGPVADHP